MGLFEGHISATYRLAPMGLLRSMTECKPTVLFHGPVEDRGRVRTYSLVPMGLLRSMANLQSCSNGPVEEHGRVQTYSLAPMGLLRSMAEFKPTGLLQWAC